MAPAAPGARLRAMLGIDLVTAAFLPAALVALLAGILSFLSPCVLPIVPPYLAYMTGVGVNGLKAQERSAVLPALFFVMGLHFLHVIRIPILDHEARMNAGKQDGGAFGAYILGLAFAFGWTPCIGPQLGMILSLAATGGELSRGTALLAVYALGLGIPFLLAAIFVNRAIGVMNRIKPWLRVIERAMGVLLLVVGVMLLTGAFSAFSYWLLETFPALATLG